MSGRSKLIWRVSLEAVGLGLLVVPLIAVSLSGTAAADPLWTALRLAALEGLTLVFADIMIGALRPSLSRVFKVRTIHRLHTVVGASGLALVMAHAVMLLVFGLAGYSTVYLWIGPAALALLVLTVVTALLRRRLKRSWKWVHRLNYLVFAGALVHALGLGSDVQVEPWLKVLLLVYAGVILAALIYRSVYVLGQRRPG